MIIISYDISNTKLRTKFSKYIKRFGRRLQYSVYEITNCASMLENIRLEILHEFEPKFKETDSVYILKLSKNCEIDRLGYAKHEESDIIFA